MDDFLEEEFRGPRFEFLVLGTFGALGLVLVSIGVFSVMMYSVSLRTREIGVRIALGAERGRVVRMVLKRALSQLAAGSLIGVGASMALTRLVKVLLWGVPATDPLVFSSAVTVLLLIGSSASVIPALRAARIDPLAAIRCE